MASLKIWLDMMRPKTLPASAAPVIAASVYAFSRGCFDWIAALLALCFALAAQIASNLANDYYDYRNGSDGEQRVGPRRHIASGDVSPASVVAALCTFMSVASAIGVALLWYSGQWWLIFVGILIVIAAVAYSGGPFPLSRYGLGDVAVVLFFGIAAVCLTFYVQSGYVDVGILMLSLAVGLATDNILVVNNYRDMDEDSLSGKKTLIVRFGRKFGQRLYYWNGVAATFLVLGASAFKAGYVVSDWVRGYVILMFYMLFHTYAHNDLKRLSGRDLNPLLGKTARNLLILVALYAVIALTVSW